MPAITVNQPMGYFPWEVMIKGKKYISKWTLDEPGDLHAFTNSLSFEPTLAEDGSFVSRGLKAKVLSEVHRLYKTYDYERIYEFLKPRCIIDESNEGLTFEDIVNAIVELDRYVEEFFGTYGRVSFEALFPAVKLGKAPVSVSKSD